MKWYSLKKTVRLHIFLFFLFIFIDTISYTISRVRTGIILHQASFTLFLPKEFKIIENYKVIYSGKNQELKINSVNFSSGNIYYFVLYLGDYKSYEQAYQIAEKLRNVGFKPQMAYPLSWQVWIGKYYSLEDLNTALEKIEYFGFGSAKILFKEEKDYNLELSLHNFNYITKSPVIIKHNGLILIKNINYPSQLEVVLDSYGTFSLISITDIEDYIKSVLPSEMPLSAPMEALKAQSILARTYYLKNKEKHSIDGYELCGTTDCQVYGGSKIEKRAELAVNKTRGIVLSYKGEVADALYHSTCGGVTADFNDVWDGDKREYLKPGFDDVVGGKIDLSTEDKFKKFIISKKSSFCKVSKYYRWEKKLSKDELIEIFKETIPKFKGDNKINFEDLINIKITSRSKSGRVEKLTIKFSDRDYEFLKDEIRWILGGLKSNFFLIENSKDFSNIVLKGGGWGHGVGLCQIGAIGMAKRGKNFKQIIEHYYPATKLEKIY